MTAVLERNGLSTATGTAVPRETLRLRLRYAGGRRDVRLDLLRGFAAFGMIVDHIGGHHSWLYTVTGGNRFFVSAAEAFIVISGLVMGMVYAGYIAKRGFAAAARKILSRAGTLYLLTVLLTLGFALLSWLLRLPWRPALAVQAIPSWTVSVLTLHQTYFLTDIPLLYTFLVLAALPVLALLVRGKWRWVLGGAWGLWGLWQVWPEAATLPWAIRDNTLFHLSSWQAPFITALVIGYHRPAVTAWLARVPLGAACAVSGVATAALVALTLALPADVPISGVLFDKANVAPGRVAAFVVVGAFAYTALTVVWTPVQRALGWLLLPLGTHALTAYSLHIFVVALTTAALDALMGADRPGATLTMVIQLAGVAMIWGTILAWPALAAWGDSCRHCLIIHTHGAGHRPWRRSGGDERAPQRP